MRYALRFSILIVLIAACCGCPEGGPGTGTGALYTNADLGGGMRNFGGPGAMEDVAGAEGEAEGGGETVREVVEPDVIRRVGNLLYVLNQYRGLSIVDLDTETLLAQVPTLGYPRDLYVSGTRAYVLVGYANNVIVQDGLVQLGLDSRVFVLDIAEPAEASIINAFDLEGDFVDSRLVGGVLYAVSANFQWYYDNVEGGTGVVTNAVAKQQTSDSWVTSVNISDPNNISVADSLSFGGYGDVIQATSQALFVTSSEWDSNGSAITYVDISDPSGAIQVRGSVNVPGYVADRFKMDVYNGVLRVVSNTGWPQRNVYVTTVNLSDPDALAVLGQAKIENASGETLFATRFDGPRAYVVTYLQVDPLFVLDLSDPSAPHVAGELIVPGWSTHIEPQGDRLIALGVDDTNGRRVSVSLYDVANPAQPALLGRATFGQNWSWSAAFDDVKAFTVLDGVLIVPFGGWEDDTGGFERLQFLSYTRDSLDARGYVDLDGQILRSLEYNGAYYGVSTEQLATIDGSNLDAPVVSNRLTLAEYVADFLELSNGVGAEVISRFDQQSTLVRTVGADGAALGSVEVDVASLSATHAHGTDVVLVTSGWEYANYYDGNGYYRVVLVDCSAPEAPVVRADIKVDVEPYWGGWWGYYDYYGGPVPMMGMEDDAMPGSVGSSGAAKMIAPWFPYWTPTNVSFVAGDVLALRCGAADFDETFGDKTAQEGLALVDLESGAWTGTAGLGYDVITSVNVVGNKLYIGTKSDAGKDTANRSLVAMYISEFDPAAVTMGPRANVPGSFVQYDPSADVLVVEEVQYAQRDPEIPIWDYWFGYYYDSVSRALTSVSWDGGESVAELDTLEMPAYRQQLLGRGGRIYYDYYDEGYEVTSVEVGAAGALTQGAATKVSGDWASLLDAEGDMAYMVISGRALAPYDFSGATPVLGEVTEVMSSPLLLRFGADTVYAPLGYSGLLRLEK